MMIAETYCMTEKNTDFVMVNLKVTAKLREEFKVAAKLEGMDLSNMLRQFMIRTVRDAKEREPESFQAEMEKSQAKQKNKSPDLQGGGAMTEWDIPVTPPANREKQQKRNRA
jgi:hypothetical protein